MMTIRSSRNGDCSETKNVIGSSSPRKQTTPFSIDDILSNTNELKSTGAITGNQRCFSTLPLHFSNFCTDIKSGDPNIYHRWLESLHQLFIASSFHSPWLASSYAKYSSENLHPESLKNHFYARREFQPPEKKRIETSSLSELNSQKAIRKRKLSNSSTCFQRFTDSPKTKSIANRKNGVCLSPESSLQSNSTFDADRKKMRKSPDSDSPLSALEKLTCTTFKNMEDKRNILHAIAAGREAKVKRRKCRTAFSSFQLSVLEQRFKCHKYLTPTDRDQIAHVLGLSAPQVITWFQNRRAKQKRDLEELKNDIRTVEKWTKESNSKTEVENNYSLIKNNDENDDLTDIDIESC